jgi:Rod binding domain-containing protein
MLYVNPMANYHAATAPLEGSPEREKAAVRELEQYFIYTLLRELRDDGSGAEALLETGPAFENFREMLDDGLSREIAASGQFGLAGLVERQLHAADVQRRAGSI